MDIVLIIISGICTLLLALFGIVASINPPQTKKGNRNIILIPALIGVIGIVCLVWQSVRSSRQLNTLEQALSSQYRQGEERQKVLKESLSEMNDQLFLLSNSPDIDLRKRAIALSRDILQFVSEREAGKPSQRMIPLAGDRAEQWEKMRQLSSAYEEETRRLYLEKFAARWESVLKDMKSQGIDTEGLPKSSLSVPFVVHGIDDYATRLGEIGVRMPKRDSEMVANNSNKSVNNQVTPRTIIK